MPSIETPNIAPTTYVSGPPPRPAYIKAIAPAPATIGSTSISWPSPCRTLGTWGGGMSGTSPEGTSGAGDRGGRRKTYVVSAGLREGVVRSCGILHHL